MIQDTNLYLDISCQERMYLSFSLCATLISLSSF